MCLCSRLAGMEMDYNLKTFDERFQVVCLFLAKIVEKLIMVCSPSNNSLDIFFLMFQEHFVCKRRHFIVIFETQAIDTRKILQDEMADLLVFMKKIKIT